MKEPFKRLIVWGLKTQAHTHRFIHQAFYENARKVGYEVAWLDNKKRNNEVISRGDLIIAANVAGDKLEMRPGAYYCFHNFQLNLPHVFDQLDERYYINLQVFTDKTKQHCEKLGPVTYLNRSTRTLVQPWGTDLLGGQFFQPSRPALKTMSFWIGSVWNNALNQGNVSEFRELDAALRRRGIKLLKARVPNLFAIPFIRNSVIAPSVAGRWQVENNYLPCRMFKNISYGQLGVTNVKGFEEIFSDAFVHSSNIEELVDKALSLSDARRAEMISVQQEFVSEHTYERKLMNILRAFEILNSSN
jgi:hypothetical protein